ncbi:hypothetical protein AAMO2058_000861500, partial [Amorphochlora amoebiformis]
MSKANRRRVAIRFIWMLFTILALSCVRNQSNRQPSCGRLRESSFASWLIPRERLKQMDICLANVNSCLDTKIDVGSLAKCPRPKDLTLPKVFDLVEERFLSRRRLDQDTQALPREMSIEESLEAFKHTLDLQRSNPESPLPPMLCDTKEIIPRLQRAHWFYQDHWADGIELPAMGLEEFCRTAFAKCPSLRGLHAKFEKLFERFQEALNRAAVFGVICLSEDMERLLMVRGYMANRWGFPRGKLEFAESPHQTACREVKEETGYDLSKEIDPDMYIQNEKDSKISRMYLIILSEQERISQEHDMEGNRDESSEEREIGQVKWVPISDLYAACRVTELRSLYMPALPFLPLLKKWVSMRKADEHPPILIPDSE